jgi:hypothetical protein
MARDFVLARPSPRIKVHLIRTRVVSEHYVKGWYVQVHAARGMGEG